MKQKSNIFMKKIKLTESSLNWLMRIENLLKIKQEKKK